MQQGSIIKAERKHGPAVWQFRWSETGSQLWAAVKPCRERERLDAIIGSHVIRVSVQSQRRLDGPIPSMLSFINSPIC